MKIPIHYKRLLTRFVYAGAIRRTVLRIFETAPIVRSILLPLLRRAYRGSIEHCSVAKPAIGSAAHRARLLIDVSATFHQKKITGIQRAVCSLVAELCRADADYSFEPLPVRLRRSGDQFTLLVANNFPAERVEGPPVELRPGDSLLMLDASWDIYPKWADEIFPLIRSLGGRITTCVFDILPITNPEFFPSEIKDVFAPWYQRSVKESDQLLAISKATADEIHKNAPGADVAVFHLGADFATPSPKITIPREGPESFLVVGTIEPRKGHATVLDAFEILWRSGAHYRLTFVGRPGWNVAGLMRRFARLSRSSHLFKHVDGADDALLASLYDEADVIISPSLAEGFGLPVVEGLARGKTVIASDIPAYREVAGDEPLYFRKGDPESLIEAITRSRETRRFAEPTRRSWVSWRQSADQLAAIVSKRGLLSPSGCA